MKTIAKWWTGIALLVILSPLGLIFAVYFKSGPAWGEGKPDSFKESIGYIPQGLVKLSNLWKAPLSDYALKGSKENGLVLLSFSYIISAILGIVVTGLVVFVLGKVLSKKGE